MATKKVGNVRLWVENSEVKVSILDIDAQDLMNKTVVLADDDDITPRDVDIVKTGKFLLKSDGDWEFVAYLNKMNDFNDRDEFDEWALTKKLRENEEESVKEITFEDALYKLGVEFSLNTKYYLDNQCEIEKDLNRKLNNLESLTDQCIEDELLYKQLCELFGENGSKINQYDYILNDFHFLQNTGNTRTATATRGKYYLKFKYFTS